MRRRPLQLQLQLLASAATDVSSSSSSSTTMSSRPPYRGGRSQGRRGFSDRPYTGGRAQTQTQTQSQGQAQFVSGDSHFRSVRDANLGFRQGGSGGRFSNQTAFRPRPRPPPPNPYNNQTQRFRPFDPNQTVRPPHHFRPKPLDYRNWELAAQPPPPNSERFIVVSYNILADYLANSHRSKLYYHIPRYMLDWEWRKKNILFELGLWSADIMCLQEVDRFLELEEQLKLRGYSGIWKMRTGIPVDGCAIFWRTSRFKLLHEECIEFNKLGLRDNVAQICVLELMNQNCTEEIAALPTSSIGSSKVVICNIHVLYNPKRGEVKIGQVRMLLNRAHSVSKLWDGAPVILCGDFNCTPKSPLYNFISEQKLDLSEVDRDKVSGQATAEIPSSRPYNSNSRNGSINNPIQDPSLADGKEIDIKLSDSVSHMQKLNNADSNMKSLPAMNNSQPQCANTMPDLSDESCSDMRSCTDDGTLLNEVKKEIQQNSVDSFRELHESNFVPGDGCKGDSSTSYGEGGFPIEHVHNEINKFTPVASHPEEVYTDATYTGYSEGENAPSHSNNGLLSGQAESNDYIENESVNHDNPTISFLGIHQSTKAKIDSECVDPFNSEISSSEPSCQTSFKAEVIPQGDSGSLSAHQIVNDGDANASDPSTSVNFLVDEKLENFSLNELDKAVVGGDVGEDESTFLSALHEIGDACPSEFGQLKSDLEVSDHSKELESVLSKSPLNSLSNEVEDDLSQGLDSESVAMEKYGYDPSLWTPMEIETATGSPDCTLLEHPLMLSSTYVEVKDCSGTRDSNGEPLVTSYNRCFFGTVDYIWRSEGLQTVRVLAPMQKQAMQWTPGFPTKKWGSDHIALAAELAFMKDLTNHNTEVL
ncbi:hypothetical protein CMV_010118 [Castanea mollissima]|uniref:Endonuclease/exonuclease/phosphatase domain-containing protein n=1 Tax=Castanea mollissima TaxID=60419 RepID=A0A8J4RD80_9ROSI|nr:hypothetical protein CMV_010118 [Castanea mollissima]